MPVLASHVSSNYTTTTSDEILLVHPGSGTITITVDVVVRGCRVVVRNLDSGTVVVQSVTPNSIEGRTSVTVRGGASATFISDDGQNWWIAASSGSTAAVGTLRSGFYYVVANSSSLSTSNTLGNGTIRLSPFFVPNSCALASLGVEVTVAGQAGAQVRLGIYSDNNGIPDALLLDAGTVPGDAVATPEVGGALALSAGTLVWVAACVQNAGTTQPTLRTVTNLTPTQLIGTSSAPSSGAVRVGYTAVNTAASGALPAATGGVATMSLVPRAFVRIA